MTATCPSCPHCLNERPGGLVCARWPRRADVTASHYCGEHPARQRLAIAAQMMAALVASGEGVSGPIHDNKTGQFDEARTAQAAARALDEVARRALAIADSLIAAARRDRT